ncbi:MAG: stalk domain-containing protein [Bacillota bacterium]
MMQTKWSRVLITSLFFVLLAAAYPSKSNAVQFSRNLSIGNRGPDVTYLQERLKKLGYLSAKPDGAFGRLTYEAVTRFERALGFPVDGVVTRSEWVVICPPPVQTANVRINGQLQKYTQPPVIINGSTLVPLRGIFEALGAQVTWANDTKTITAVKGDITVVLQIGGQSATKNGSQVSLLQPAMIINSVTMVPARFVGQAFGAKVDWDSTTRTVFISTGSGQKMVLGYYPVDYPGDNAAYNSLLSFGQSLTAIAFFALELTDKNNFSGSLPGNGIKAAGNLGAESLLVVHNYRGNGFDRNLVHKLLNDRNGWDGFIDNIVQLVKANGLGGVNIDLENIPPSDKDLYSEFLRRVSAALKPDGFIITVAVPAKTSNDLQNAWSGAFDYEAIGRTCDYMILMTYDEHWLKGAPGPVASISWVTKVVEHAVSCVQSHKLLLGIPTYGYDWSTQGAKVVRWNEVDRLLNKYGQDKVFWDSASATPCLHYKESGVDHEVWFENQYSLKPKLDLVHKYDLAGIGIWRLGFEDSSFWETVRRYF